HQWLDPAALAGTAPTVNPDARAGLFIATHGTVSVSPLVRALVHGARLAGAVSVTPTEILHVEQKRDVVYLNHAEFDHVVVAAGSWTRRVRVAGAPVFPVRP